MRSDLSQDEILEYIGVIFVLGVVAGMIIGFLAF